MDGPALFLSYNSVDRPSVVAVPKLLAAGITTFLDRDQLVPGRPWPAALEEGLRGVRAVAVFIGRELGAFRSAACTTVTNDGSPETFLLNIGVDDEHRRDLAREGDASPSEAIIDLKPE